VSAEVFNFSAEVKRTPCFKLFKRIRTKHERSLQTNINSISISVQCFIDKTVIISKHSRGLYKQQMPLTDSHNLHFDRSTNRLNFSARIYTSGVLGAGNHHDAKLSHVLRDRADQYVGSELLGNQGSIQSRVRGHALLPSETGAGALTVLGTSNNRGYLYGGKSWLYELYERVESHLHYTTHLHDVMRHE
jgi:hypothetical protein